MVRTLIIIEKKSLSQRGFTLVELMVVVAITALIAGLSLAEISSASHKLKGAAQTLRAKMQQAKLIAVKDNCNVYVDFDLDGGGAIDSFYTIWRDLNNNTSYDAALELVEQVTLPSTIVFGRVASGKGGPSTSASGTSSTDIVSFSGDSVRFTPQGTGSPGWAYLHAPANDAAGTYAVGSNNVGRIQTRYWTTEGGSWR